MELIPAASGYNVDLGGSAAPVFRREIRTLDVHFANKVDANVIKGAVIGARIQVETTVNSVECPIVTLAVEERKTSALDTANQETSGVGNVDLRAWNQGNQ